MTKFLTAYENLEPLEKEVSVGDFLNSLSESSIVHKTVLQIRKEAL